MSATDSLDVAPPGRGWLYLRISEDHEADELGIARQEKSLRAEARRLGIPVAGVLVDNDVSAYSGKRRPGFEQLLASLGPGDTILVTEATRLTRGNLRAIEDLIDVTEALGVTVHAMRAGTLDLSSSGGRMVARMLGVVARQESEVMGERISAKHAQRASMGKAPGGTLQFGYRRVGDTIEPDPVTAPIVRELVDRVLAGESVTSLARELNARGITTTLGNRWQTTPLARSLKSPTLAAIRMFKGEVVGQGAWDPIIDRETHERVVAILTHAKRGARPRAALLAGLVVCAECGTKMVRKSYTGGQAAYTCPPDIGCGSNSASANAVDRLVTAAVLEVAATIDLRAARAALAGADASALVAALTADERQLAELEADRGLPPSDPAHLSRAGFIAAAAPVRERIEATKAALAALNAPVPDASLIDNLDAARWEGLTFEQRRQVLGVFIERVTIPKGARTGNRFDESRVLGAGRITWRV